MGEVNTDRAQLVEPVRHPVTVQRAEWDALLQRIAEIERVGAKNARDLARLRRTR